DVISQPILECISPFKKVYIMKIREFNIFLTFKVIFTALRYFLRREILLEVLKNNIRNGILLYAKDAYHAGIINQLNPKTVISFIDNNPRFGRLSFYFKNIKFIAIQNGMRLSWATKKKCNHDVYLTFTNDQAKILKKSGWQIRENHSIGSVNAARIFISLKERTVKRNLLIVSSWWSSDLDKDVDCINHYNAMKKMNIFLNDLIIKKNYVAEIILRTNRKSDDFYSKEAGLNEEEFYRKIYGDNFSIIENKTYRKDVYEEISNSNLSVSLLSTAVLEGHIYGHNCLYLNFFNSNYYHVDFPKEIVISSKNKLLLDLKIQEKIKDSKKRCEDIFTISKEKAFHTIENFKKIIN
ncbi:hypothetical protein OA320_03860, partial [Prochlorococcus sp. AH-716-O10]|nr:hypothetical protein [Prochlorococcus sp. AH-716-O10]